MALIDHITRRNPNRAVLRGHDGRIVGVSGTVISREQRERIRELSPDDGRAFFHDRDFTWFD